jgi:glycosyltransferase involved in cell wall biosynthesis
MRILQLAGDSTAHYGGVAHEIRILRDGLTARGHTVDWASPSVTIGELKIGFPALRDYRGYDIVHVHGPTPFVSDLVRLNRTVSNLVLTYHSDNSWLSERLSAAYLQVHRLLHSHTPVVIVETRTYADRLSGMGGRIVTIPPPGPTEVSAPQQEDDDIDKFRVIFVGQLRPYKGVEVLLAAARALPMVDFVVVGRGPLEAKVSRCAKALPNVEFLRGVERDRLIRLYRTSHVVCLPSVNTSEAFGICLLEGATQGAVPIASSLPGVAENVRQLGGELFSPGDWRQLRDVIGALATNRAHLAERAVESVRLSAEYNRKHTPETYVQDHLLAYNSSLQSP